jgi:molecular chaperone Hsp33
MSNIPTDDEGFAQDIIKDDLILPFQLESSSLRGRIVRLGSVLDGILSAHDYPDAINTQMAETITLTAMLSSMLKYEGIFTLQAQSQGEGAVSMLVADMVSNGDIRGCATFNEDKLAKVKGSSLHDLMGKGYIAFTVDQGEETERYQGIVELKPEGLIESVQHYFTQSEQIATGIILAVGKRDGKWRAQGMMLQHMPEEGGKPLGNAEEDDWRRAMILMQSCKEEELLDPALGAYDLLTRLFHEEGVRVYNATPIHKKCRCSEEKVKGVLKLMSEEDIREMIVDGSITMTCEFCSTHYTFDPATLALKLPN